MDPLSRFSFVQSYCILHLTVAFPVKYFFKLLAVLWQYKKSYWAVSLQYFGFYCSKEKVLKPILMLGIGPVLLILAHPWSSSLECSLYSGSRQYHALHINVSSLSFVLQNIPRISCSTFLVVISNLQQVFWVEVVPSRV